MVDDLPRQGTWMMHVYEALVTYDDFFPQDSGATTCCAKQETEKAPQKKPATASPSRSPRSDGEIESSAAPTLVQTRTPERRVQIPTLVNDKSTEEDNISTATTTAKSAATTTKSPTTTHDRQATCLSPSPSPIPSSDKTRPKTRIKEEDGEVVHLLTIPKRKRGAPDTAEQNNVKKSCLSPAREDTAEPPELVEVEIKREA